MGIAMLLGTFVVLLLIGVPVAYALGAAALATLLYLDLPTVVLVQQISAGSGSASLIAIPLFIFAGELMLRGGISERLIALASSLVGRRRKLPRPRTGWARRRCRIRLVNCSSESGRAISVATVRCAYPGAWMSGSVRAPGSTTEEKPMLGESSHCMGVRTASRSSSQMFSPMPISSP